ncbi:MAG: PstS family phosphate ABC transporter substrate-binding protein, partial [Dehalococcoidia bacterium]
CDDDEDGGDPTATVAGEEPTEPSSDLSGSIEGDGSSTVYPITEAVQEEFLAENSGVDILVGISGTGGGFERFCVGETDFNDASRAIEPDDGCEAGGIEYVEFEVAYDGLAVMVNPANDFVECLTIEELTKIWEPAAQETITNWNQVRDGFPDQPLTLYGPGTDSGTFDYFTDVINGEEGASRGDYTASEDDNTLVTGIAGDEDALGYFGVAYYEQNQDSLKLVAVDSGTGCVLPESANVLDGTYAPLSRPLYVYVATESLQRPEVAAFMRFYMEHGAELATEVGYVEAPAAAYEEGLAAIP